MKVNFVLVVFGLLFMVNCKNKTASAPKTENTAPQWVVDFMDDFNSFEDKN